jgi:YVTN family beta-propeller protein
MVSGSMSRRTSFTRWLGALFLAVTLLGAALVPGSAAARGFYILDTGPAKGSGSILVGDTKTNALVGAPLTFAAHPGLIVFSPDGTKAYIVNQLQEGADGEVLTMDTRTNQPVGAAIPLPTFPTAMAISPDGARLYLTLFPTDSVLVIDLATGQPLLATIPVGKGPEGVAITPDGSKAYVTNRDEKTVSVIDLRAGTPITTVAVKSAPQGVAITPDGKRAYVANGVSKNVSVIDTATNAEVPGSPVAVGESPNQLAVAPDGRHVYVANFSGDSVSVIDTATLQEVKAIPVIHEPLGIAITPDGKTGYVTNLVESATSMLDTVANAQAPGEPIKGGTLIVDVGIVPDQPPVAALRAPRRIRPGVPVVLNGSGSIDPDGTIANYAWNFGDGKRRAAGARSLRHTFARPGKFTVTLTTTDDEGCSTRFIYTGKTVSCNGSGVAAATQAVRVSYPTVAVRCPVSAGSRGCRFKLRAVTKRHGRPQTTVTRVRVKAGKAAKVPLRPKRRFARRLALAGSVLVEKTVRKRGSKRTGFARLRIVG